MTARVITVANRKGGVGKTTTVVNVAAELGGRGRRVLVVDLDTQAHASLGLGVLIDRGDLGVHGLFRDPPRDIAPAIRASEVAGVDVLPPARDFEVHDSINDPLRLQRALKPLAEHYDDVVIDTSPAIDVTMVAALAAADRLLIPTQLQHLSYEGVTLFAKILLRVATLLNRRLADFAVVPIQVDMRVNLQRFVLAKLVSDFGPRADFSRHPQRRRARRVVRVANRRQILSPALARRGRLRLSHRRYLDAVAGLIASREAHSIIALSGSSSAGSGAAAGASSSQRPVKASYETIRAMLHENAGIEVSHQTVARYCREVLDSTKPKKPHRPKTPTVEPPASAQAELPAHPPSSQPRSRGPRIYDPKSL